MVEQRNYDLHNQLGISDDDIISKFSDDFSLKLLSPLVRLKRELCLSLPDLVPRQTFQENSGVVAENEEGVREDNVVETRYMTNDDDLDLEKCILQDGIVENTCNESELLHSNLESTETFNVNASLISREKIADDQVANIKRKRGRPPKKLKCVGGNVSEAVNSTKTTLCKSTVFPPRKEGRQSKNGLKGHGSAVNGISNTAPGSRLHPARSQTGQPFTKSEVDSGAVKHQIIRKYPLRKLLHSKSGLSKFPGYCNGRGQGSGNTSAVLHTDETSRRSIKNSKCIAGKVLKTKEIPQEISEPTDEISKCDTSESCNPENTSISVESKERNQKTCDKEPCEDVCAPISLSEVQSCAEEKGNPQKNLQSKVNTQNSHIIENLPLSPICVDRSAEKLSKPSSGCQSHCTDSGNVYDITASLNDKNRPVPPSEIVQRRRGRPPKQTCQKEGIEKFKPMTVLSSRKLCGNRSEMITSHNLVSSSLSQGPQQTVKKRGRGRPRKNCQEESEKVLDVKKLNSLHQETECSKSQVVTDMHMQHGGHETEVDCSQLSVPEVVEGRQDEIDVLLLDNTPPNPVEDVSGHIPNTMQTPGWKDKPPLEYQVMSDDIACLTPPGSNECLSISGDDILQSPEESIFQKSCQSPSESTISYSYSATDFFLKDTASSPSSHPDVPNFHHDVRITAKSSELLGRTGSCSPRLPPEKKRETLWDSEHSLRMTEASQGNAENSSAEESDGLSQVRIAKTISLSQDEPHTSCTGCHNMENLHDGANTIVNENDPVSPCDVFYILPKRERENIFQALGGGLDSPHSNPVRDTEETGSITSVQQEQTNLSDPDIPCLEAYGGCHYGYASNGSPHSGASDTLPILEKEAFHDTCPNNEDDEDEFEFENPSGETSEFDMPSENISAEDSFKNWPRLSNSPQSDICMSNVTEQINHNSAKEDIGLPDDEEEFEFETPEEEVTIHQNEKPSVEQVIPSLVIIDSLTSHKKGIHDDQEILNETDETDLRDEEQFENSFPNLGLSPNPLENLATLQSNSASSDSNPMTGVGYQDCTAKQLIILGAAEIPAYAENPEKLVGNNASIQEVCEEQGISDHTSLDGNPGDITENDITIISDQSSECRLPDIEIEDKEIDKQTYIIPDNLNKQGEDQDGIHSESITRIPWMLKGDVKCSEMEDTADFIDEQKIGERDQQSIEITSTAVYNVNPNIEGINEQSMEMKASAEYNVSGKMEGPNVQSFKIKSTAEYNVDPQIEGVGEKSSEGNDTSESNADPEEEERDREIGEVIKNTAGCVVNPVMEGIDQQSREMETFVECIVDKKEESDEQSIKVDRNAECSVNPKMVEICEQPGEMKASLECIMAGTMEEDEQSIKIETTAEYKLDHQVENKEKSSKVNKLAECSDKCCEKPRNSQEIEREYLQTNVPVDEIVTFQEQLSVSDAEELHNTPAHAESVSCIGNRKMIIEVAAAHENEIQRYMNRGFQDESGDGEELFPRLHFKVNEFQKDKHDSNMHQLQDTRLDKCFTAVEKPYQDLDNETKIISDIIEEILSTVSVLQDPIAKLEHVPSPVSEALQGTFESPEDVDEVVKVPSSHENCSLAKGLQEPKQNIQLFFTSSPDVSEISSITPQTDVHMDTSQSSELQKHTVLENTDKKNTNPLSVDFQNESGLEHSQLASTSLHIVVADTLKESNSSSEQDIHSQVEETNPQPNLLKDKNVQDYPADHQLSLQLDLNEQKSALLDQTQNVLTAEQLKEKCPKENPSKDPAILVETLCAHTEEGSNNLNDTTQAGQNLQKELSETSEELVNLVDGSKEAYKNYMYLEVSAGDETTDMLTIACEETVGGYDEDAMSATSSGGATIAYPLSDGDNWDDRSEGIAADVVEVEDIHSSVVQDRPNPTTCGQGTDVAHSQTACKWTVIFKKAKKKKRSNDGDHKKSRRKSHKKYHDQSTQKPRENENECHLQTTRGDVAEEAFEGMSADTCKKLPESKDVDKSPKVVLQEANDNGLCKIRNHQEVDNRGAEKEFVKQLEETKSSEEPQCGSAFPPIFKSPPFPYTQSSDSIHLETNPRSGRKDPVIADEELQEVSNSDERPVRDDCKLGESMNGDAEEVMVTSVEDPILIDDDAEAPSSDQELYSESLNAVNPVPVIDMSLPSVSLPNSQDVILVEEIPPDIPSSQGMANIQIESANMQHSVRNTSEKGIGNKTVHHIPQDKATFFGTPRKDKIQSKPNLDVGHSLSHERFYLPHAKQYAHFFQQSPMQMMPLRHSYLNHSGACNELKQHLLNKQKLSAPNFNNQFHHSQSPITNQATVSEQNAKFHNSVIDPAERDLALNQLAQLHRQSHIERGKKYESSANRRNSGLTFHQIQTYEESLQHIPSRTVPVDMSLHYSGTLTNNSISSGLSHKDNDRRLPHGNRVATAGTFSPPFADDIQRSALNPSAGQIRENEKKNNVGYLPVSHHLGYAENIPVYTASGPEKQLFAVYPDGCVPVPQTKISTHLNIQQSFHHTKKTTSPLQPFSKLGKISSKANMDRDEMLVLLRQLHGGNGAKNIRNIFARQGQPSTQTSGIPSIQDNTRVNQIPALIQKPSQISSALHQMSDYTGDSYLQNPLETEHFSQTKNTGDAKPDFYPHSQSNEANYLANAPVGFHNMTPRTPTPRMHSRTPTPVSNTTSTSDNFTNQSLRPTTELERTPLSRTSTPRSRCTPSSSPHISESPLPGKTETPHLSPNNCSTGEDMPLDLTCKVRTNLQVERIPTAPLDLSCKPRQWDTESQEQKVAKVCCDVGEESTIQDTLLRSHSEDPGSDIVDIDVEGDVDVNVNEPENLASLSCSSDLSNSINSSVPVVASDDRRAETISHQDQNISRQDVNVDLLRSKLVPQVNADKSSIPVNNEERSEKVMDLSSAPEHYQPLDSNVYIDRAGGPHAFSDLLHHGLTSEGPGLKIAKTYNKFANPVTSTSSIPLIDLTSIPKKVLILDTSEKSTFEVDHRQELMRSAKTPPKPQEQIPYVPCQLRRTRSDDSEVRHSSGNIEYTSNSSPSLGYGRINNPLDSSNLLQNITRSCSSSNIVVTSTNSNLPMENSLENLKRNVPGNVQSKSDMSQCPKKRFKRAHEESLMQSDVPSPSKMPSVKTDSDVKRAHPSGSRKRGRPRGSKKTFVVSQEVPVAKQCKFCQFATTSRQEMKNHVNEKHFEKYRIKTSSEKSNSITNNPDQHTRLGDEVGASITTERRLCTLSSKVKTNIELVRHGRKEDVSQEISNMQRTGTDYCQHCDQYFSDTTSLAAHQRIHHKCEEHHFGCRLCDFCDSAPGPLVYHVNKVHSKELKGGPCPFRTCNRRFLTVKEVKDHLNDHWIEKQYACKICGIRYQVLSSLKAHLDRHRQNFPNICEVCNLSFKTPGTLLRHQKLKSHLPKP